MSANAAESLRTSMVSVELSEVLRADQDGGRPPVTGQHDPLMLAFDPVYELR
jgi:hypothetical protein